MIDHSPELVALRAAHAELVELKAGMTVSFVAAVKGQVQVERERDAALAALGRVRALLHPDNPLRAIGVREADIQAALEGPS